MRLLLRVLLEIYPSLSFDSRQSKRIYFLSIMAEIIIYLQNIQFFWNTNLKINGWKTFQGFWIALSSPALSNVLSILSPLPILFFIILSALGLLLTLLTLVGILKFFKYEVKKILTLSVRFLINVIGKLCFIPTVLFLLKFYSEGIKDFFNAQNQYFRLLVTVELIFVLFLALLYETVQYELRPLNKENFSTSKINVNPDLFIRAVEVLNCILATYTIDTYYGYYLISCTFTYGLSFLLMINYLPYYSKGLNMSKSFFQLSLASISLFFYSGYLNDDAFLILALTILMQPIILLAACVIVNKRINEIQKQKKSEKKSFNVFELSIRQQLRKNSDGSTLKKLSKNFKITKDKYALIISSYYCQDILGNYSQALNKIHSAGYEGLNFPLNYQIYKAKVSINAHSKRLSFSFKLFKYIKEIQAVKLDDEKFCGLYVKFFYMLQKNSLKLSQLKKLINEIVRQWKTLCQKYQKILKNYPYSREAREMFGTLLSIISENNVKSLEILRMPIGNNYKGTLKQNFINDSECLAMFSADNESFGRVRFLSKEFILKLRIPKDLKTELEICSFVPPVFYKVLEKKLLELICDDADYTSYDKVFIYLQDGSGFFHECKVSIHYIRLSKQKNFIISVSFLNKNRDFAMICKEGLIYGHSELFSSTLGYQKTLLSLTYIEETIPSINMNYLLTYKYDEIYIKSSEDTENESSVQLELKNFSFFGVEFISIYLSQAAIYCDFHSEGNSEFFEVEKTNRNTQVCNEFQEQENLVQVNDDKMEVNESTSGKQGLGAQEENSLNKSRLVMKVTKVILLLLVILLTSFNVVIVVNVNDEVKHSLGLDALTNLNYLANALAKVSVIVRSIDVYGYLGQPQYFTYNDYEESINDLIKYQKKVFDDYSKWKYCDASRMINDQVLPYWIYKSVNESEVKYGDVYSYVDFIRENANSVISKIKKGAVYKKEMANVISNTQAGPLNIVLENIDVFIKCETNRAQNLETLKTYFLIGDSILIALCFLFTTLYLLWSDKHQNILWENLRARGHSYSHSENLQSIIQRLHSNQNQILIEEHTTNSSQQKLHFFHSLRFLVKLSWLFIASIVHLILTTLIFYKNFQQHLYYRPLAIGALSGIEVQMSRMSFTVLEYHAAGFNYSFQEYYSNSAMLEPPELYLASILLKLESAEKILINPSCTEIMSQELWDLVFNRVNGVSAFIQKGSLRAMKYLYAESQYNLFSNLRGNFSIVDDFVGQVHEFNENVQKNIVTLINNDSETKIRKDFSTMVYFDVFFSLFLLLSYFFYYLPMVQNEIEVINGLREVIKLMPRS